MTFKNGEAGFRVFAEFVGACCVEI